MGRGRDLTDSERALVHNKVMQNWDSEKRQIKVGGKKIILKACITLTLISITIYFATKEVFTI